MSERTHIFIESQTSIIRLSAEEARLLQRTGRALAASSRGRVQSGTDRERSLIKCAPLEGELWQVTVLDAIGVIVVGASLQIQVLPKIPVEHLLYLLELSGALPRLLPQRGAASTASSFWELVARWYVTAVEGVIRREMIRDYAEVVDETECARGSIRTIETATGFYAGRLAFSCEFDEFGLDAPINRILKRAASIVAGSAVLQSETRRRAAGLRRYLEDVGEMHPGDERVQLDRRTAYYRDALTLGRHILSSTGRSLDVGTQAVWTFLFRTPLLVERGIREVLRRRFGPQNVSKRKRRLGSSSLTLNPDLTIGHPRTSAVADVKYKVSTTEWKRNDLYQAVAFAVGFRVRNAAIIEFVMPDGQCLEPVSVGDIVVRHLCWPADPNVPAAIAADALATDFAKWLLSCRPARVTWTSEAARS